MKFGHDGFGGWLIRLHSSSSNEDAKGRRKGKAR